MSSPASSPSPPSSSSSSSLEALSLRSPDALLSALPYLLGFTPTESVVLVWLRRGRILLTQRLDLPGRSVPAAWSAAAWEHRAAMQADETVVVLVSATSVPDSVQDAILRGAQSRGIAVRDVLQLHGQRWRSLLCTDASCCPSAGRSIDAEVSALVAAEFTLLGRAPVGSRDEIAASMQPDAAAVERMAELLRAQGSPPSRPAARERWRETALAAVARVMAAGAGADAHDVALVLTGVADIRVRDAALWDAAQLDLDGLGTALTGFSHATRQAPSPCVAPVATCAAVLAWLAGDGVRAGIALERALSADSDYSLALLVDAALRAGMPPATWRSAMGALSRDDCRHGLARGASPSAES